MLYARRLALCRFRFFRSRRDALAGYLELRIMLVQESEFLQFEFLRAGIVFQSLDELLFLVHIARKVRVLFLEHADLLALFRERTQALRPAQHDRRIGGQAR